MGDCVAKIEREGSGWCVEMRDPKLEEKNKSPSKGTMIEYTDPWVEFKFDSLEQLTAFLMKALPVAAPQEDEFTSSFDKFAKAAGGEKED